MIKSAWTENYAHYLFIWTTYVPLFRNEKKMNENLTKHYIFQTFHYVRIEKVDNVVLS